MAAPNNAEDEFRTVPLTEHDKDNPLIRAVAILAEEINGANSFNMESAAYGYIDANHRLIVPPTIIPKLPQKLSMNFTMHINSVLSIAYWNYLRLRSGTMQPNSAFFVAMYRARLISTGYLYRTREQRSVLVDEVDSPANALDFHENLLATSNEYKNTVTAARSDAARIRAYMQYAPESANAFKKFIVTCFTGENTAVIKHLTFCADQYAAMTYLVFRQYGHHYKTEYEKKYTTLWRATTLEMSPRHPGHHEMHRIAIHSFGVKTLHEHFFALLARNKLAETFVDRKDVSPCGTASVGTCNAAFQLMKALPMWGDIYSAYAPQIDTLEREAMKLKDAAGAIAYHKNARLFGVQHRSLDATIAHSLAPIAKGFINSMGQESDMYGQRTLDKRAQQNPVMVDLISQIITKTMEKVVNTGKITGVITAAKRAQPQIMETVAQEEQIPIERPQPRQRVRPRVEEVTEEADEEESSGEEASSESEDEGKGKATSSQVGPSSPRASPK